MERWRERKTEEIPSEDAFQPELVRPDSHKRNDIGDVLIERKPDLLRAFPQIVAADSAREGFVFHALDHRRRLEIEDALRWPDERGGGDEPGHLIARIQGSFEPRFARNARVLGVRQDRA